MKESFEASGRHKRFFYLWSQHGLRMRQISMFQLTLRKTDSERRLQTSSCVVAFDFFSILLHETSPYEIQLLVGKCKRPRYDDVLGP